MPRPRLLLVILLAPVTAAAQPAPASPSVSIGGYIQPQAFYRQNDPVAPEDEDGFRLRRARLLAGAHAAAAGIDFSVQLESELTPEFQLLDAYLTARRPLPAGLVLTVDAGQVKAPISRQELLSDANLAFPEKAELASLAPSRQLGARVAVDVPITGGAWVKAIGGMFNGEGRNQIHNIDEKYLFAGRLEIGLAGHDRPFAESDLDGVTYLVAAGSIGHDTLDSGDGREQVTLVGFDVAGGWRGSSAVFEYLQARHRFSGGSMLDDFRANGFAAQAGYVLPIALCDDGQLEVAARLEEIDRNDTVPIVQPGDPNQSLRTSTAAVSYYQRGHAMKAQLAYSHIQEVEKTDRTGRSAEYHNDLVLLQLTYRME